jgi:hypothetical protein
MASTCNLTLDLRLLCARGSAMESQGYRDSRALPVEVYLELTPTQRRVVMRVELPHEVDPLHLTRVPRLRRASLLKLQGRRRVDGGSPALAEQFTVAEGTHVSIAPRVETSLLALPRAVDHCFLQGRSVMTTAHDLDAFSAEAARQLEATVQLAQTVAPR